MLSKKLVTMRTKLNSLLFLLFLSAVLLMDSCKCNEPEVYPDCPTCEMNMECYNGVCRCKEGYDPFNSICIYPVDTSDELYYFIDQACFSFDSVILRLSPRFYQYLTDTSAPVVIGNEYVNMMKTTDWKSHGYEKGLLFNWNAKVYKLSDGRYRLRFTLKTDGFDGQIPVFFGWTRGYEVRTRWDCFIDEDLGSMDIHQYLQEDLNRDGIFYLPDEETDSCFIEDVKLML